MMPGFLVDTNVLSELRRPKPAARVLAFFRARALADLFVSDITIGEIHFGAELHEDPVERVAILNWLDTVIRSLFAERCLQADEDAWLIWKMREREGRRKSYTYPQPDLVIAAIALRHGLTVVTRDDEPFRRARVPVIDPRRQEPA